MSAKCSFAPPGVQVVSTDSPAILRLKMLEMKFAARSAPTETARQAAHDLIDALRRSIAEKPALSFADLVAKLKTCDEITDDESGAAARLGEKASTAQIETLRRALADWRRLSPTE
jgi:hypothetical protein